LSCHFVYVKDHSLTQQSSASFEGYLLLNEHRKLHVSHIQALHISLI
jgi:hypothetical protein